MYVTLIFFKNHRWDSQMNFKFPHMSQGPLGHMQYFGQGLRGHRSEVFPLLSRSNNIGFEHGIHAPLYTKEEMMELQYLYTNVATRDVLDKTILNDSDETTTTIKSAAVAAVHLDKDNEINLLSTTQSTASSSFSLNNSGGGGGGGGAEFENKLISKSKYQFIEKTNDSEFMRLLCLNCSTDELVCGQDTIQGMKCS
jgi:hypothetical protein